MTQHAAKDRTSLLQILLLSAASVFFFIIGIARTGTLTQAVQALAVATVAGGAFAGAYPLLRRHWLAPDDSYVVMTVSVDDLSSLGEMNALAKELEFGLLARGFHVVRDTELPRPSKTRRSRSIKLLRDGNGAVIVGPGLETRVGPRDGSDRHVNDAVSKIVGWLNEEALA